MPIGRQSVRTFILLVSILVITVTVMPSGAAADVRSDAPIMSTCGFTQFNSPNMGFIKFKVDDSDLSVLRSEEQLRQILARAFRYMIDKCGQENIDRLGIKAAFSKVPN